MSTRSTSGLIVPGGIVGARVHSIDKVLADVLLSGHWNVICRDSRGREKWRDVIRNLVTNAGEDYILDAGLSGGTQITSWFVGLTDGTPTVAEGDTMSSHVGWVEITAFSQANRVAFVDGGVSGQSLDNSASVASFGINANSTTIGGAFLGSNNTKGGSTGTLYAVGAFSAGDKTLDNGDSLDVTATFTAGGN